MKLAILTSRELRHRYLVQRLREVFDLVAVGYEDIGYEPQSFGLEELDDQGRRIVLRHFNDRTAMERRYFGHHCEWLAGEGGVHVEEIPRGALNGAATIELLRRAEADRLVVFGTNLIRPPLLAAWTGRMVNLHLGLSPYYRGTATNFYPLLNEEPEYVGATVHEIDAGIDSGAILGHVRPSIERGDGPHEIGCKAIDAGIAKLIHVLQKLESREISAVPQWSVPRARLYLRRHFHPRQVVALYRKLENGLIERYLERVRAAPPVIRLVS